MLIPDDLKLAYRQYLKRTGYKQNSESYFEFICAKRNKLKIAQPLKLIEGSI